MRIFKWMQEVHHIATAPGTLKQKAMAKLAAQEEKEARELAFIEEEARLSLHDDRHMIRRAIEQELFDADPPKEPQPYVQAQGVFPGTETPHKELVVP